MLHCLHSWDVYLIKEVTNYVLIMDIEFSVSSTNHIRKWIWCWVISIPVLISNTLSSCNIFGWYSTVIFKQFTQQNSVCLSSKLHCPNICKWPVQATKFLILQYPELSTCFTFLSSKCSSPHFFVSRCLHVTYILIAHEVTFVVKNCRFNHGT